ncbi:hypothetical protein [Filimonas effusa]|uniref:Glycoside hydrolase family 127 protein n=1 Tax=Filimonas effusa TaxID=2508721 RepID=A0A4Q1D7Y3_9BACT|nr:hypothetical protein [Filimonas effusa]RXK85402.1 hypothetical protein ESB13_00830 [Filimonas effusa]
MKQQRWTKWSAAITAGLWCSAAAAQTQQPLRDYPIQPVAFTKVHLHDHFWEPKIEVNANVTIPYVLEKCREKYNKLQFQPVTTTALRIELKQPETHSAGLHEWIVK